MAAGSVVGQAMVEVGLDTKKAEQQAAAVGDDIGQSIADGVEKGTRDAERDVQDAAQAISKAFGKPIDLVIDLQADNAERSLRTVRGDLDQLVAQAKAAGQTSVVLQVKGENIDQVLKELGAVDSQVEKIDGETANVKIDVTGADESAARVKNAGDEVERTGNRAISSLGGLRDVSGALGGMGTAGLDAGEGLIGVSDTLAAVGIESEGLSAALGGVGLAIGVISVAIPLITSLFGGMSDQEQLVADDTKAIEDAFKSLDQTLSGTDLSTARLEEVDKVITKLIQDTPGLAQKFNALGIGGRDLEQVAQGKISPAVERVRTEVTGLTGEIDSLAVATVKSAADQGRVVGVWEAEQEALKQVAAAHGLTVQELKNRIAVEQDAVNQSDALRDSTADATAADDAQRKALEGLGSATQDSTKDMGALARQQQDTEWEAFVTTLEAQAKAAEEGKKALGDLDLALLKLGNSWDHVNQLADAFNTVSDEQVSSMFAIHQGAADVEEGIQGLIKTLGDSSAAFKDTGSHISSLNDDGRKALDSTQQLAESIGKDLAAELRNAGGDFDVVRAKAGDYRDELIKQMTQLGITSDEQQNYLEFLNLTPEQVETTIKLAGEEEARQKLLLLQGVIDKIPTDVQTEYTALVAQGKYEEALALLQNAATPGGQPRNAPMVASADTTQAEADLDQAARDRQAKLVLLATVELPPGVELMAGGTMQPGQVARVGEAGWETLVLPEGGRILPHWESVMLARQAMAQAAGGGSTSAAPAGLVIQNAVFTGEPRSSVQELSWAVRYRMRTVA